MEINELAKRLDMSVSEYYDYFIETYINWQYWQLKEMLKSITFADCREDLVEHINKNEYLDNKDKLLSWVASN